MTLIDNAKDVLLKAWSVRWLLLANTLAALPMLTDGLAPYLSTKSVLTLTLLANIAALVSRFIKQDSLQAAPSA